MRVVLRLFILAVLAAATTGLATTGVRAESIVIVPDNASSRDAIEDGEFDENEPEDFFDRRDSLIHYRDETVEDRHPPRAHANTDAYDNLVVYHGSGYKQIILGGALILRRTGVGADDLFRSARQDPAADDGPSIIYLDGARRASSSGATIIRPPQPSTRVVVVGECVGKAVVVRGRSFMYGLDRTQVPHLAGNC